MSVTYTSVLPVRDQTVDFLTSLLTDERVRRGTRAETRALSCHDQAVLVLRWFLDGTRMSQLARDNAIGKSTGYEYLHEGIDALAAKAPGLHGALLAAKAAGYSHVNIDGMLVETDRGRTPGPTPGLDLWWSGKHDNHGGNIQVITVPDGWPIWTSQVRPGREHDTTALRTHTEILPTLTDADDDLRALGDLGYEGESEAITVAFKKPKGRPAYSHPTAAEQGPQQHPGDRRARQLGTEDDVQSATQRQPGPMADAPTRLSGLIRAQRRSIGSRWRRLSPGRQALLVLAHLRNGDTYARLAEGFGIGVATVFRYIREAVDLLAALAPSLTAALWRLAHNGHQLGVLDGTVVRIDRLGGTWTGCTTPVSTTITASTCKHWSTRAAVTWSGSCDGLPGSTHDLTAARIHHLIGAADRAQVELLVDKGYQGAGGTTSGPHKGRKLTNEQKAHNRMVNSVRAPGERGFAVLKTWRIFTKVRCCPQRVAPMAKAVLVLERGTN